MGLGKVAVLAVVVAFVFGGIGAALADWRLANDEAYTVEARKNDDLSEVVLAEDEDDRGDGDRTRGNDGTSGGNNTGDGDRTRGNDGTSGGNNTGDGDWTVGNDGTSGGNNTGDGDWTVGNDGTSGGDNTYVPSVGSGGGGDDSGGGDTSAGGTSDGGSD